MRAALMVGLTLVTAPAWALGPLERFTVPSGPAVVLAPRGAPTATLRVMFRAGSFDDQSQSGITKLAVFGMLCGNRVSSYRDLSRALYEAGGTLKVETDIRSTSVVMEASRGSFDALAGTVLDMLLSPRMDASLFEDARARALRGTIDTTSDEIVTLVANSVFSNPGFENTVDGNRDTIRELEFDQVRSYAADSLAPANATVVVAGSFDTGKLRGRLKKYSGGSRRRTERPNKEIPGTYQRRSPLEVHVLGYAVNLSTTENAAAARLSAAILGEAVQHRFRNMGAAYSTATDVTHREWLDSLLITIPINQDRPVDVVRNVHEEVEKVRSGKLDAATFERNKSYLLKYIDKVDADPSMLARDLALNDGISWSNKDVVAAISAATVESLGGIMKPQLAPERMMHVLFSSEIESGRRQ